MRRCCLTFILIFTLLCLFCLTCDHEEGFVCSFFFFSSLRCARADIGARPRDLFARGFISFQSRPRQVRKKEEEEEENFFHPYSRIFIFENFPQSRKFSNFFFSSFPFPKSPPLLRNQGSLEHNRTAYRTKRFPNHDGIDCHTTNPGTLPGRRTLPAIFEGENERAPRSASTGGRNRRLVITLAARS